MKIEADYRGELAIRARETLGYTQKEMGQLFGITLRAWQDKEQNKNRVSVAEYHLLMLLLNEHSDYLLVRRLPADKSVQQKAAEAALELGQYLASGVHTGIALPSKAESMLIDVQTSVAAFCEEFRDDTLSTADHMLPPK